MVVREAWIGRTVTALIVLGLILPIPMSLPASMDDGPAKGWSDETAHPMTATEMERLKVELGVRDPATDYNAVLYGHGTGYAPPTEDQYTAMVGTVMVLDAPNPAAAGTSCDLSADPRFPAVGDQGKVGSCAAWALAYYCYGYLEAKDNSWTEASLGNPSQLISPSWCYNKVNGGLDDGTWMGEVGSVLTTWGGATLATMPYDGTKTSSSCYLDWGGEAAFREAPLHRASSVITLSSGQTWSTTLSDMRAVLASGTPITFALDATVLDPYSPGDGVITSSEYGYYLLNHAQTIVGYDDGKAAGGEVGAFKVVNSWGDDFWGSGYYWITYQAFQKILSSSVGNQLVYVTDRTDHVPSLLGVWHYSVPQKQDVASAIAITTVSGTGVVRPYYWKSSYTFPDFLCLDLSDLRSEYDAGHQTFELTVAGWATGTLSSFRTELYAGGYTPGAPAWVSGQSPEAPISGTSIRATSTLPQWPSVGLAEAMDLGSLNLTTGGPSGWAPTGADAVVGGSSARSGDVASTSSSWLKLTLRGSGILAFDWKMAADPYQDSLILSVSGTVKGSLSGNTSWAHVELPVQGNSTEVVWSFYRQGYGGGCAYIDNLTWSIGDVRIDGNEGLQALASQMRWPGSGVEGDPYIIDGYASHRTSSSFGLYIGNTTLWMEIVHGRFSGMDRPGEAGLCLFNAANIVVKNSTFTGNYDGIVIDRCSNVNLTAVSIAGSAVSAIRVVQSAGVIITGCNISENAEGLWMSDSQGTVYDNLFYRNTGLAVRATASPGSVYYVNVFVSNNGTAIDHEPERPQAADDSASSWDIGIGNYWSDLSGPDLDGDGTIDGASYSVGGSADNRPVASIVSAPRDLRAVRSGTDIMLTWNAPELVLFVPIGGYEVTCSGPDGTFTFTTVSTTFLDDRTKQWGEYSYVVRAVTWLSIGPTTSPVLALIPDGIPPSVAVLSPQNGARFGKTAISFSWTFADGQSGMDRCEIGQDGGPFSDVGLSTTATLTFSSAGSHRITVRAFDLAGNSAEDTVIISIDLMPPAITMLSPASGEMMTTSKVVVSLTVNDVGTGYHRDVVRVDGSIVWSSTNIDPIQLALDLGDGIHELKVTSTDRVGNIATYIAQFTVDTTSPMLAIIGPAEGGLYNRTTAVISWTAEDAVGLARFEVRTDEGAWTRLGAEQRSCSTDPLTDGQHTVTVRAVDLAGNVNESVVHFLIDTVAVDAWLDRTADLLLSGPIEVRFSKSIVPATVQWSLPFPAEVAVDGIVTIMPSGDLEAGRQYTVMIRASGLNGLDSGWIELIFSTVDHGVVSGTIIDPSGRPIEGAIVTSFDGVATTTDRNGSFSLELPFGPTRLAVHKDGYVDIEWGAQVQAGGSIAIGSRQLISSNSVEPWMLAAAAVVVVAVTIAVWRIKRK